MPSDEWPWASAVDRESGESGDDIAAVQEYLRQYGYLPDEMAVRSGVGGGPISDAKPGVFDKRTAAALRQYQDFHGLPVTGLMDAATLSRMAAPRCGIPDFGVRESDGGGWPTFDLTYGVANVPWYLKLDDVQRAMHEAFAIWTQPIPEAPLMFCPGSKQPHIGISFAPSVHPPCKKSLGNSLAHAFGPAQSLPGQVHLSLSRTWAASELVPRGSFDLVAVLAHEIGHAVGIPDHQGTHEGDVMFPSSCPKRRPLSDTDRHLLGRVYR